MEKKAKYLVYGFDTVAPSHTIRIAYNKKQVCNYINELFAKFYWCDYCEVYEFPTKKMVYHVSRSL